MKIVLSTTQNDKVFNWDSIRESVSIAVWASTGHWSIRVVTSNRVSISVWDYVWVSVRNPICDAVRVPIWDCVYHLIGNWIE